LLDQVVKVEPSRKHREVAIGISRPRFFRAIPIEFDAVFVRVTQIKRLTDAVIAGAIQGNARLSHTMQRVGQCCACGIQDGGMKKPPLLSQVFSPMWW